MQRRSEPVLLERYLQRHIDMLGRFVEPVQMGYHLHPWLEDILP